MSVVVVAVFKPRADQVGVVLDAFERESPNVHAERGCELYAAHTDDQSVVLVERWSTEEDLDAHAQGEPLQRLRRVFDDALTVPYELYVMRNVPFGVAQLGTIR